MAEGPLDSKFDTSDLGRAAAEAPKSKKKRSEPEAKPAKTKAEHPLPGVHDRPKKARKAGGAKSGASTHEEAPKSEVEESLAELRNINEEREWEKAAAAAKKKIDEEGQVIEFEAEPASQAELEDAEWEAKISAAKKRDAEQGEEPYASYELAAPEDEAEASEDGRALAAYKEAHPVLTDAEGLRKLGLKAQAEEALSKGYEARLKREAKERAAKETAGPSGFTAKEDAWFKAGEDEEARQMAEARATIERGGKGELMVENPDDIEANVKAAADLMKKGDLSPRDFSVEDYAYLLKERVRIDKELEHAGWWKARGLRKELAQVLKGGYNGAPNGLESYEKQVMDAKLGNGAMKRVEAEKSAPAKKPSFWERLRMSKGR